MREQSCILLGILIDPGLLVNIWENNILQTTRRINGSFIMLQDDQKSINWYVNIWLQQRQLKP